MSSRRETLRILGTVSSTCAFPFAADELYGQQEPAHQHSRPAQQPPEAPSKPRFFRKEEWATLCTLCDLIIPPSGTPGAVEAGVPQYIDLVVSGNKQHQSRFRQGLAWVNAESAKKFQRSFPDLTEAQQVEMLTPLVEAADRIQSENNTRQKGKSKGTDALPEVHFLRVLKNMTADGYYTSKVGLVDELGYNGNTVLEAFPDLPIREH